MDRFEDKYLEIYDFANEILIICPKCSQKAYVITKNNYPQVICHKCGYQKKRIENKIIITEKKSKLYFNKVNSYHFKNKETTCVGGPYDPYFKIDLYLKIDCCGNILFAFNNDHLQYIKNYVGSKLRERNKSDKNYKNRSMISRLPKWIKNKNNREEILKKIKILESKITNNA